MNDEPQKPPRVVPRLKAAPKIRQILWCDFPKDAQLPEFWKRRPVVILSKSATLFGAVTVVACSTDDEQNPKLAFPLRTRLGAAASWAICDKPMTVAVSRLSASPIIPRLPQDEFDELLRIVLDILPKPPP